jgi:hypothetical protein
MITFIKNGIEYETIDGVDIPLPPRPPVKQMGNYGVPKKQQKWSTFIKNNIPVNWNELEGSALEEFIAQQFERRYNGLWWFNNGQPTYICGDHFMEISGWWKVNLDTGTGAKYYKDRDRRVWLHFHFCETHPKLAGQAYMKHRRDGATSRAGLKNFNIASSVEEAITGIQSKKGTDAKKVYINHILKPFRRLPSFFQPIIDGSTKPQTGLKFEEPAERITKNNQKIKQSSALGSYIGYETTKYDAYDSQKLNFFHGDEFGKCTEMDVYEAWQVVRECLFIGSKKVGVAWLTTTCAEMIKKGGKNWKRIWLQSSVQEFLERGETTSGLLKLFIAAFDGLEGFVGEFGESIIDKATPEQEAYLIKIGLPENVMGAKEFLQRRRDAYLKSGDTAALSEYKRLYPFTESEALRPDVNKSIFDTERINMRLEELTYLKNIVRRGNFIWENNKRDTRVVFHEDKNGRYQVAWLPDKSDETNVVTKIAERYDILETGERYLRNIYKPNNIKKFCGGVDPVDHSVVTEGTGSKAAGYVFSKYNALEQDNPYNNCFIVQYLYRPKMAKVFYEDMVKLCVFFGCEILYETQKVGIKTYFEDRGYGAFLMIKPKILETKREANSQQNITYVGAASSPGAKQQIAEHTEEYIYSNCTKVPFVELLEDWLDFDIAETEKYDATMAAGWTLIAATKHIKEKPKELALTSIIPSFNNSGTMSKINPN